MDEDLHFCSNNDKLYMPRIEGVRDLMSVRYGVELETNLLLHPVNSDEKLLKDASEKLHLNVRQRKD